MPSSPAIESIKPRPYWLAIPSVVVAITMLYGQNGWLAMMAFHGSMTVALLVYRQQICWRKILRWPGRKRFLIHLAIAVPAMALVSWLTFHHANQHAGFGRKFDAQLTEFSVAPVTRLLFAVQLCLLNPVLEELFWRGLFFRESKRPALTDIGYGLFHFFALWPFMRTCEAMIATVGLIGFGYTLRRLTSFENRSLVPAIVWHALGDLAIVVAIARLTD